MITSQNRQQKSVVDLRWWHLEVRVCKLARQRGETPGWIQKFFREAKSYLGARIIAEHPQSHYEYWTTSIQMPYMGGIFISGSWF